MRFNDRIVFTALIIITLFCSCKKDLLENLSTSTPVAKPVAADTVVAAKPPVTVYRTINVGTGSGNLVIDGTTLSLQCNDHLRIAKGSYTGITIKNITAATGCAIVVDNDGAVELGGDYSAMNLINLDGVTISGDADASQQYGFQFHDNVYRAIIISGTFNRVTVQHASFKNIKDYVISYSPTTIYDGTAASYSKTIKFLDNFCENTSSFLQFSGSVENGVVKGLIKDLEIARLKFINSPGVGTMVWMGNVDGYDVHDNRVDNINANNNNHNGIFHLMGNGQFHDNFISNHQGNALRAWTYSVGSTPKDVLIYDNIVVNSRKYGAFEVQSFANYMSSQITFANAEVYNNTCGQLNTSKDWYGNVVDVYGLQGGTCKVFNNIGFDFPAPNPVNSITNQQSVTKPDSYNNVYYNSIDEVGFQDQGKFTLKTSSAAKNKGVSVANLIKDYYGMARNIAKPSIGAVE